MTVLIHAVQTLSWQWSGDENAARPQLIRLPGDPEQLDSRAMSIEEMDERLKPYLPPQ